MTRKKTAFADLYTREGETLSTQPWDSYPRPQLRREQWVNLNGEWEFTVSEGNGIPHTFDRTIRDRKSVV